jgi:hypothetical protein
MGHELAPLLLLVDVFCDSHRNGGKANVLSCQTGVGWDIFNLSTTNLTTFGEDNFNLTTINLANFNLTCKRTEPKVQARRAQSPSHASQSSKPCQPRLAVLWDLRMTG